MLRPPRRHAWAGALMVAAALMLARPAAAVDTTPPTTPTGVTATPVSYTQINLSWTASTDNVGVTGYQVEGCGGVGCSNFTLYLTTSSTSVTNINYLQPTRSYSFRIRATDAAGNLSGYSTVVTASTFTDSVAPSTPTGLTATPISYTQINLSWTASTDNVAVANYQVEACSGVGCTNFVNYATVTGTSANGLNYLQPSRSYSFRIRAADSSGNVSGYSTVVTASTLTDTVAPSTPTGLTATPISYTQINLSWTASTDNVSVANYQVEACSGVGCTNFVNYATVTGTNANGLNYLQPSRSYSFRIRAADSSGNVSGYSTIVTASTFTDTVAPSTPTGVSLTVISATQINVSWTASTDNVGVANYQVEACGGVGCSGFTNYSTVTGTSANGINWLQPSRSYSFRVRAADASGNLSGYSTVVTAVTANDITAPNAPTNLVVSAIFTTQINVAWTAATDNVAVTGYRVERCAGASCTTFVQIGTTATSVAYNDPGLPAGTTYRYRVRATDAAGNLSGYSNILTAATLASDTQAPTVPLNPGATAVSATQINVTWAASTDNVGVTGYRVERCAGASCTNFAQIATPTASPLSDTGLTASTLYQYRVRATDAVGNVSAYSAVVSATTSATDTQAPTVPTGLSATAISSTQITLSWTASTDNVGVTGYRVERCSGINCSTFTQVATPAGITFGDSGLTASTSYSYRVRAADAAGNLSGYSSTATATTQTTTDTTPPSAPTALSATALSGTQISIAWAPSTDNVGVTGYRVERCSGVSCTAFAQVATGTSTSFGDAGLTASTSYSYRVRASDAAGNLGGYSPVATAVTLAAATTSTYIYDATGHLKTITTASGVTVQYTYDAAGNLTGIQKTP
jgi:YD repeat-containing protein